MKAKRINAKQAQGLINNENESFNDQPAITNNGDSKVTSISFEGKSIKIKCLLANTKVCKWDKKYPENHNHYIITVSCEGKRLYFDWFDSFQNFKIDKMGIRLLCGMPYASKKINIIECLKALIFTNLQTIYKKHLIFNDLKR